MYKIVIIEKIHIQKKIMNSNSFVIKDSDEWARNRFKILGYDKKALPQSSMKSKNKT